MGQCLDIMFFRNIKIVYTMNQYIDTYTGKVETLLDKTSNSYLMTQTKLTDKGVDCTHWFNQRDFTERFKEAK